MPIHRDRIMAAIILKTFAAFMTLQMLLVASRAPDNCPIYTCPNGDRPIAYQRQPSLFSRLDPEDDYTPSAPPVRQAPQQPPRQPPSTGFHIGPNEISESAGLFSREILKVSSFSATINFNKFKTYFRLDIGHICTGG